MILGCVALMSAGLALATGAAVPSGTSGIVALLALAVVGTVVPVLTSFAGMERVGPTETASLSAFEPAVTVALAAVLLGEWLAPLQLLGGALVWRRWWCSHVRGPGTGSWRWESRRRGALTRGLTRTR